MPLVCSPIVYFCFHLLLSVLWCHIQKCVPGPRSRSSSLCFLLGVSGLVLTPLIHFELIFVRSRRQQSCSLLPVAVPSSQHHLWPGLPFPIARESCRSASQRIGPALPECDFCSLGQDLILKKPITSSITGRFLMIVLTHMFYVYNLFKPGTDPLNQGQTDWHSSEARVVRLLLMCVCVCV